MSWRIAIGVLLLVLQAGAIVRARFVDDRYFCWAPFDQQTKYEIGVAIGGEGLAPSQGVDNYSINGHKVRQWRYPQ